MVQALCSSIFLFYNAGLHNKAVLIVKSVCVYQRCLIVFVEEVLFSKLFYFLVYPLKKSSIAL